MISLNDVMWASNFFALIIYYTVMVISFQTDNSGQTVQTQIRLLLEEQSDQGLHYLQYCLHLLDALLYGKTSFFESEDDYSNFLGCPKI